MTEVVIRGGVKSEGRVIACIDRMGWYGVLIACVDRVC